MDVVAQGVEEEAGLLLNVGVGPQDQEDIEPQLLEEDGHEVVLTALEDQAYGGNGVLVVVFVVELAEAGHFLFYPFVLRRPGGTVLEM